MSGMYKPQDGDVIYRTPPQSLRTGPESNITLHGVYKSQTNADDLDYCAVMQVGSKEAVVPESNLKSALIQALCSAETEVMELPKRGGRPEQGSVMLNFNDISKALSYINDRLPKRAQQAPAPGAFGG